MIDRKMVVEVFFVRAVVGGLNTDIKEKGTSMRAFIYYRIL